MDLEEVKKVWLSKLPPKPKSALGCHRLLCKTAGIRVSPLCLGSLNFGNEWTDLLGKCDKGKSFEILDFFFDQGGNFIDTAGNYQNGESEEWIGEWIKERGVRDQIVLATKFTSHWAEKQHPHINSNFIGNSTKSLVLSLEASLKKLQTHYVDILYVHWWDFSTSIPELMQSLNHLVVKGSVLYLGVSDTPAWIVSKANEYARNHALRTFSVYQGQWSAADRDMERDIIPMTQEEGMGIAPWGVLGGGFFKPECERANSTRKMLRVKPSTEAVAKTLEAMSKRMDVPMTSIALAYVLHKSPYVFPIVGGRSPQHLEQNIKALSLKLCDDDIKEIESAYPFDVGFPNDMIFTLFGEKWNIKNTTQHISMMAMGGPLDDVAKPLPIRPRET